MIFGAFINMIGHYSIWCLGIGLPFYFLLGTASRWENFSNDMWYWHFVVYLWRCSALFAIPLTVFATKRQLDYDASLMQKIRFVWFGAMVLLWAQPYDEVVDWGQYTWIAHLGAYCVIYAVFHVLEKQWNRYITPHIPWFGKTKS